MKNLLRLFYKNLVGAIFLVSVMVGMGAFAASFTKDLFSAFALVFTSILVAIVATYVDYRKGKEIPLSIDTCNAVIATLIVTAIAWGLLTKYVKKHEVDYNKKVNSSSKGLTKDLKIA